MTNRHALRIVLLVALGAGLCGGAVAQEAAPPPPAPGEPLPLIPGLKTRWNELDTSWMRVRLNVEVLEDGAFYSQDAANQQQVGDLSATSLFRVDDLSLSGQLKFTRPWSFTVGGNYRGLDPTSSRGWTTTYLFLAIPLGKLATVTVGKQKENVGLEMTENGRELSFMERATMSTAFTFIDSHVAGVRFSNTVAAGRVTWSAGWFNDWLDDGLSFSESGQIFAGRLTGLPVEADGGRRLLHVGVSAAYRQAPNGSIRLKSVPEVYEAPDFVDTGSFPADHGTTVGAELAVVEGPVTVSGEYAWTGISSSQTGDPSFDGWYVTAAWALTGEARPYNHTRGAFGMMSPAAPFSFKHGGPGAWEVAARYSSVDLTSGSVQGGKFDRLLTVSVYFGSRQ
jgi:phosphate-selective porin OprO/OprP